MFNKNEFALKSWSLVLNRSIEGYWNYWKIKVFESWFERRIVKYKEQRNGKFCDSEIIIKHKAFVRTFNTCYKRFQKHYTQRNECFCDCIMLVWEGMQQFKIKGNSNWENIATGNDPKNYGKLVTYVKSYVTHELERKLYPKICTSTKVQTPEGKKYFLVYYNIEPESLNRLVNWKEEKEKVELINCIKESYWTPNEEYQMSMFLQWAKDNMKNVLSKKQMDFLKLLEEANYSKLEKEYQEEIIGIDRNNIRQRLKRIYEKLAKEYKKANKYMTGGYVIQSINAEIKVYQKILNIIDDENIPFFEVNARLSAQILKSMNNTHFTKLLYDNLDINTQKLLIRMYNYSAVADSEDFQLFIEPTIPSKYLDKIVKLVQKRKDYLEKQISKETKILDQLAKEENIKVNVMQFPTNTNKKCIHLRMNSFGIAVPKYEN